VKCELLGFHTCSCAGVNVAAYHAGMNDARRARTQEDWTQGHIAVLVATVAFGM
jgi:ATP-dependent DNA helicase RecQ